MSNCDECCWAIRELINNTVINCHVEHGQTFVKEHGYVSAECICADFRDAEECEDEVFVMERTNSKVWKLFMVSRQTKLSECVAHIYEPVSNMERWQFHTMLHSHMVIQAIDFYKQMVRARCYY